MNENTNKLINIIQQNPNLPIVPMVNSEIINKDDAEGYWLSSIGDCFVDSITITVLDDVSRIFFKHDIDEIKNNNDNIELDEITKVILNDADKVNWTQVIVVLIEK